MDAISVRPSNRQMPVVPLPPFKLPRLNRKPPRSARASAAPAIADPLDQSVLPAPMVPMVSTDCPALPETVVPRPRQPPNCWPVVNNNARANPDQPAMLAPVAPRDPTDPPATLVPLVPMVDPVDPDPKARLDLPELLVLLVIVELLANLARPSPVNPAHLDPLDPLASPVPPAALVNLVDPERMVAPAPLAHPAMLVLPEAAASPATLARPETPASLAPPAAASTAHRLVWPPVIKPSFHYDHSSMEPSRLVTNMIVVCFTLCISPLSHSP